MSSIAVFGFGVDHGVGASIGILGQSNERSSIYSSLVYTPSAFSGAGGIATVTTSMANNLPIGEVFYGRVTGAAPAGYNTSGDVLMTVVGTWPNGKITYASAGTGALSTAGTLTLSQKLTYPEMFASQRVPNEAVPIYPVLSKDGSWWHGVFDALFDAGYNPKLTNGSIGGMSFVKHACGQIQNYSATTRYRVARAATSAGDAGCVGEFVVPG